MQTNWYVVTGAPSSGKTAVITYLSFLGHHVLPEAARVLLDVEQSRGKTIHELRADERAFQQTVLRLKLNSEARLSSSWLVFLDRGLPDTLAYYRLHGFPDDEALESIAQSVNRYRGIFLLAELPFVQDPARVEGPELSHKLTGLLRDVYQHFGYTVVSVPPLPLDERVAFMLKHVHVGGT